MEREDALALDAALRHPRGHPGGVGVTTWVDAWDIRVGTDFASAIDEGIAQCNVAIFLLSDAALSSEVVRQEWSLATSRGLTRLPVMFDKERQLDRLRQSIGGAWSLLLSPPVQAWQWQGSEQTAADILMRLGLPAPLCPCGADKPYDRCHARWHTSLPTSVSTSDLLLRSRTAGSLPLGVADRSDTLVFRPEVDRHIDCVGSALSGRTNLAAVVVALAARRLPGWETHLIAAVPDARFAPGATRSCSLGAVDVGRPLCAAAESLERKQPTLLVIDDADSFPSWVHARVRELANDPRLHLVVTRGFNSSPEWRDWVGPALRIQLQDGAHEFGRSSTSATVPGRATAWGDWPGARAVQLARLNVENA